MTVQFTNDPPSPLTDDPTVQGLDKARHLQTGEMIIIVVVLLMWAGETLMSAQRKCVDSINNVQVLEFCSDCLCVLRKTMLANITS